MQRQRFPQLHDPVWLRAKYDDEGLTTEQMSKEIGCHKSAVLSALIRNRIARRPAGQPRADARLSNRMWLLHHLKIMSGTEVAALLQTCPATVYRACHRLKIVLPRGHRPT